MQIITTKEVCKLIHISVETLRIWRKEGKFPAPIRIRTKGKLLWDLSVIEKWINEYK